MFAYYVFSAEDHSANAPVLLLQNLQNVFSLECVLFEMCSVTAECVLYCSEVARRLSLIHAHTHTVQYVSLLQCLYY